MEYETNPVKAIRAYCLECECGSSEEVKRCHIEKCPLYPFRFGKNPFRTKREYTDEQRQVMASRRAEMRKNRAKSD